MEGVVSRPRINDPYNPKANGTFSVVTSDNRHYDCAINGYFPVIEGDRVRLNGMMVGTQFNITGPSLAIVSDTEDIIKKCMRKGCGAKTPQYCIDECVSHLLLKNGSYGEVSRYLDSCAESYALTGESPVLPGLRYTNYLMKYWYTHRVKRRVYLFGMNNREISSMDMPSIRSIYDQLVTNPFILYPLSIDKIRDIYVRYGEEIHPIDDQCLSITRYMYSNVMNGWTATPKKYVQSRFPFMDSVMDRMKETHGVVEEFNCLYLQPHIDMEREVQTIVENLLSYEDHTLPPVEPEGTFVLSDDQAMTIEEVSKKSIAIITGGAGTGKTTIAKELVRRIEKSGKSFLLCAFTGKAASRLSVKTGRLATTIARFLAIDRILANKKDDSTAGIEKIEKHPDYIIVDEASMLTYRDFVHLVRRATTPARRLPSIVLIGDVNQLPPIAYGSVMYWLRSSHVPVFTLTSNHRFEVDSSIDGVAGNASILVESPPKAPAAIKKYENFTFHTGDATIPSEIVKMFVNNGYDDRCCVTIITPLKDDVAKINPMCQDIWRRGENRCVLDDQGARWFVGDRVMMTSNMYGINVMNGEEGIIVDIGVSEKKDKYSGIVTCSCPNVIVEFSGRKIAIPIRDLDVSEDRSVLDIVAREGMKDEVVTTKLLTLSYCMTIHKSQGSEWDFVIVYIRRGTSGKFVNRNMLYTAITRAKRGVYMISDATTIAGVTSVPLPWRCDNLLNRLGIVDTPGDDMENVDISDLEATFCFEDL